MSFNREKLAAILKDGIAKMSLVLSEEQQNLLLDYVERIHKWNRRLTLRRYVNLSK